MRTIAVTGSASGIGAATRRRLEAAGHRVIGIDLRDAEIMADLATASGRYMVIDAVREHTGDRLDGLVACAGVGPTFEPWSTIVAVNYFGALALIEGLRQPLAAGAQPAVIAVVSNSAVSPTAATPLVDLCLAGDEQEACRVAMTLDGFRTYSGSKLALARWVRRNAPEPGWAGAGIRLNAVAPGSTDTPLRQAGLDHPRFAAAMRRTVMPFGRAATPDEIAAVITFLLGPDAVFCCGSIVFVDGGQDARARPNDF